MKFENDVVVIDYEQTSENNSLIEEMNVYSLFIYKLFGAVEISGKVHIIIYASPETFFSPFYSGDYSIEKIKNPDMISYFKDETVHIASYQMFCNCNNKKLKTFESYKAFLKHNIIFNMYLLLTKKREMELFIVSYNTKDEVYLDNALSVLSDNFNEIRSFFELGEAKRKTEIRFWGSIDLYRELRSQLLFQFGKKYDDYNVADSGGNICSYEEYIKGSNTKDATIEDYYKSLCHEYVHQCHAEYSYAISGKYNGSWYSEALAILVSKQTRYKICELDCGVEGFLNKDIHYKYYYTLGRYIMENYPHAYVLELARDDKKLIAETPSLYEKANLWAANAKEE